MPSWTCPNTKCTYDKQLQPEQHCPSCGEQAKSFNFNEFSNLLKEKWSLKKQEKTLRRIKHCPKCGSTNINFAVFYRPSIWRCLDCGYEGAFMVEDRQAGGKDSRKIRARRMEH